MIEAAVFFKIKMFMTIEQQVCTLEQAKKLQELGVNCKSFFEWCDKMNREPYARVTRTVDTDDFKLLYPAFTVAELGVMLPSEVYTVRTGSEDSEYANWEWMYEGNQRGMGMFETEAQARADALISSIENKLITPEDINQRIS